MKALSKKLVKGTINQIDAVVDFTWVQVTCPHRRLYSQPLIPLPPRRATPASPRLASAHGLSMPKHVRLESNPTWQPDCPRVPCG